MEKLAKVEYYPRNKVQIRINGIGISLLSIDESVDNNIDKLFVLFEDASTVFRLLYQIR